MIPRYPVYIFDIDGTLLDSWRDITAGVRGVLLGSPHENIPDETLKSFIGHHLKAFWGPLFPNHSDEELKQLSARYREHYLARDHQSTYLYPGVSEALAALPGRKTTGTTKSTETSAKVLAKFGLAPNFEHIQGTDGFPAKPEPDVLFRAMAALGVQPSDCLFVGDSETDMEAGRRAGVATCAVTYGYGNRTAMERFAPDYWIDDLRELLG